MKSIFFQLQFLLLLILVYACSRDLTIEKKNSALLSSSTTLLAVLPSNTFDFGNARTGESASTNKVIQFINLTSSALTACSNTLAGTNSTYFTITTDTCSSTQAAGLVNACSVTITALPTTSGVFTASLTRTCAGGISAVAALTGEAFDASFILNSISINSDALYTTTAAREVTVALDYETSGYGEESGHASNAEYCLQETDSLASCGSSAWATLTTSNKNSRLYTFASDGVKTLYAWVRLTNDSSDATSPSASDSIIVDTVAPTAPSAVTAPPAFLTTTTPTITFVADSTDANFAHYEVTACSNAACSTGCMSSMNTSSSPLTLTTALTENGRYYYCVRALDLTAQTSAYTASASDTTVDTTAPTAPSNLTPLTDVGAHSTYTASWTAASDLYLSHYNAKLCENSDCSTDCKTLSSPAISGVTALGILDASTDYYTCVQAEDSAGNTSSFTPSAAFVKAFADRWTFMGGSLGIGRLLNDGSPWGTQGVASANNWPSPRYGHNCAVDSQQNLWLYSGISYDASNDIGYTTDLWKYDTSTHQWTWVKGPNQKVAAGVYTAGTQGVADSDNNPSIAHLSDMWTDANDNLWLYAYSMMWKFDGSDWTWVTGSYSSTLTPTYGTRGISAASNTPGRIYRAGTISDFTNDILYLFGGMNTAYGESGALWAFDPTTTEWTWVAGTNGTFAQGVYGTSGVYDAANFPGTRDRGGLLLDASGDFFVFGGYGYDGTGTLRYLNDWWQYDSTIDQWRQFGDFTVGNSSGAFNSVGVEDISNIWPGKVVDLCWMDGTGDIYTLGGPGYGSNGLGSGSDLWRYRPSVGYWTWIKGPSTIYAAGTYGTRYVEDTSVLPHSLNTSCLWYLPSTEEVYIFGGYLPVNEAGLSDNLFRYNIGTNDWTWMGGNKRGGHPGRYGSAKLVEGDHSSTWPPSLNRPSLWLTNPAHRSSYIYSYGGYGNDTTDTYRSYLGDLWRYNVDTDQWTFMNGKLDGGEFAHSSAPGVQGTPSTANYPGAMFDPVLWADATGDLYLYGGYGYGSNGLLGMLNTVWKYRLSDDSWVWLKGSKDRSSNGSYGVMGITDTNNNPPSIGGLQTAATIDASGDFWTFGGSHYSGGTNFLNALWKYEPSSNNWTWVAGTNVSGALGTWGTQGVSDASNVPSGRYGGCMWSDATGDLFILGGQGFNEAGSNVRMNDLWVYTQNSGEWTWLAGSKDGTVTSMRGTRGIEGDWNSVYPGSLINCHVQVDASDDVWFIAHFASDSDSWYMWKFNNNTRQFTYIKPLTTNKTYAYDAIENIPFDSNYMGNRDYTGRPLMFLDTTGDLHFYGGNGWDSGGHGALNVNVHWRFTPF